MNDKTKRLVLWIIAVVFTLGLVIYQRATGPTYPLKGSVQIEGQEIDYKLLRTHDTGIDAPVVIEVKDKSIEGELKFKRYKSFDDWTILPMNRLGDSLVYSLPSQPAAGKLMYHVTLKKNGQNYVLNEEPAIIRFKGAVPNAVLFPHIFFMFFSLLFGVRAGFEALFRRKDTLSQAGVALFTVFIGGLILGPFVQKYAFNAYWTGWPFGTDLTDNKTAIIFIFWLIAWWRLRKKPENKFWPVLAAVIMIIVYIIPHSAFGSEIDYTKQQQTEKINE